MRRQLDPGPDHPIAITRTPTPVRVMLAGETVLAAPHHFELREADYPPVTYLPRDGIDMTCLERSEQTSWCPYKGEANYYHLRAADGSRRENAVWTYETPFPAVADIKDALAVYPDRVDGIEFG
ncbi:MAG: DUF427 domain-containing protein [Pseudomonadota bacterium]